MAFRSRSVLARGGEAAQKNPSIGRPGSPLKSAAAFFCTGNACSLPVTKPEALAAKLAK